MKDQKEISTIPEILCIGFFCHDLREGEYILGGTASYASLMANNLGKKTAVLTSVGSDFKYFDLFKKNNISVLNKLAEHTTIFKNIYKGGIRHQYIFNRSERLSLKDLPKKWAKAEIVKFCLIADEVDFSLLSAFPNALVADTIQGWLRQWDAEGKISPKPMDWEKLMSIDILFMSDADIAGFEDYLPIIIKNAAIVVITKGAFGATIYRGGEIFEFPSFPVNEVDPTGAGDVFATAFLIHYHSTKDIALSAAFAHAAASFVVEHVGATIPPLPMIQQRYEHYLKHYL